MNLNKEDILNLSELYKLFANDARLTIILELSKKEMCVSEVAEKLNMTQPGVSHHLKELKQGRIVKSKKVGLSVFYSLLDNHILNIITAGAEHIKGEYCNEL